jgi:twitching motility protein PilJ
MRWKWRAPFRQAVGMTAAFAAPRSDGLDRWISTVGIARWIAGLLCGVFVCMAMLWLKSQVLIQSHANVRIASELAMHAQSIGNAVPNALEGYAGAFQQIESGRLGVTHSMTILQQQKHQQPDVFDSVRYWQDMAKDVSVVVDAQMALTTLAATIQSVNRLLPDVLAIAKTINQNQHSQQDHETVHAMAHLVILAVKLRWDMDALSLMDAQHQTLPVQFEQDIRAFYAHVEALMARGVSRHQDQTIPTRIASMKTILGEYGRLVQPLINDVPMYVKAKTAAHDYLKKNQALQQSLADLIALNRAMEVRHPWTFWPMIGAMIFSVVCGLAIARKRWMQMQAAATDAHQRRVAAEQAQVLAQQQEEKALRMNEDNEQAIHHFTQTLQLVAAGDLTVRLSSDHVLLKKIADGMNETINALSVLVGRTLYVAENVTTATDAFGVDFNRLMEISRQQSEDLQLTEIAIKTIAQQSQQVSNSAHASAEVARQSVRYAERGALAVDNTVKGMREMRGHIQETAKRLKRLGDSSLEIGEITALITEITDQTHVLALNAAIQAASAGEAGRGFSVIAEEVQRLAVRSHSATHQISDLVHVIQADTHDAIAAMERSIAGVVDGAKLSEAAGDALADIRRVSNALAELITEMEHTTQAQVTFANTTAESMQAMLVENQKIRAGRAQFSGLYEELTAVSKKLKESVSRFSVTSQH